MTFDISNNPAFDPGNLLVGHNPGVTLISEKYLDILQQLPLPGIVIFVHGVNSDGEWYKQAEEGLCKGLNERLKRCNEHMAHPTPEGGQLRPATYRSELTPEGYLDPETTAKTFVSEEGSFSPVIQFRWGYKASSEELQQYGDSIYLNEDNYWGGGPFANGCTSLPDLWGSGVDDTLFLWLHVQHINPTNDRIVFSCPPRAYYVMAALRLARLIESIRNLQPDTPITIVCHSQGNMVAIAAAFLGNELKSSKTQVPCVADTYVLCNPPYSLLDKNIAQSWTEFGMKDPNGGRGRQTPEARYQTLANFFEIIRKRQAENQSAALIDKFIKNELHKFDAQSDRELYGYGPSKSTTGRVTLYFNPHDQVISSSTIQGIGWRGLCAKEIELTKGAGVFSQRVFSQGFEVGKNENYKFWDNQHNRPKFKNNNFWHPPSPPAKYSLRKGLEANENFVGKILTVLTAPIAIIGLEFFGPPINGSPPEGWETPIDAPPLPASFVPQSVRFGDKSDKFDEGYDAPGESRDKAKQFNADDPYGGVRPLPGAPKTATDPTQTDAPKGDSASEASLRYEHHAMLRMQARRSGLYNNNAPVTEEDDLANASADYKEWRSKKIKYMMAAAIDTHATDHSTIMTNADHAQRALAYDVAVGVCWITAKDMSRLRTTADWRYLDGLKQDANLQRFREYFELGTCNNEALHGWANKSGQDASIPSTIINQRRFFK